MATRKLDHRTPRRAALEVRKREAVVNAVERGLPLSRAAALVKVSRSTLTKWRERHPSFDEAVFEAESKFIDRQVQNIASAGQNDWRASAHLLSVRWPLEFSEKRVMTQQTSAEALRNSPGIKDIEIRLAAGDLPELAEALRELIEPRGNHARPLQLEESTDEAGGRLLQVAAG